MVLSSFSTQELFYFVNFSHYYSNMECHYLCLILFKHWTKLSPVVPFMMYWWCDIDHKFTTACPPAAKYPFSHLISHCPYSWDSLAVQHKETEHVDPLFLCYSIQKAKEKHKGIQQPSDLKSCTVKIHVHNFLGKGTRYFQMEALMES